MVAISFSVVEMKEQLFKGYDQYQNEPDISKFNNQRVKRQTIRRYSERKYKMFRRCLLTNRHRINRLFVQLYWKQRTSECQIIGTVQLSSIEIIKLRRRQFVIKAGDDWVVNHSVDDLAKRDGFESYQEMYMWFNRRYDLGNDVFILLRW